MKLEKNPPIGSWIASLLFALGLWLFYQDIAGLLSREQQYLQRTSLAIVNSLSVSDLDSTSKDRQSELSSQLLKLRDDFRILGQLALYQGSAVNPKIIASTNQLASSFLNPVEGLSWSTGRFHYQTVTDFGGSYTLLMSTDLTQTILQALSLLLSYLLIVGSSIGFILSFGRQKNLKQRKLHDNNFDLFNNSSEGLVLLQSDGKILKANQIFQDWMECDEEVLETMSILEDPFSIQLMDLKQSFLQLLTSHESFRIRMTLRFRHYKSYFLDAAFYPEAKGKELTRYLVILRDTTAESMRESELRRNASSLAVENKSLLQQAFTDSLTKAYNRNYLNHLLEKKNLQWLMIEGCCMLSMDLDHFKKVNDDYGHAEGDRALQEFVNLMKTFFRRSDRIIRYGGDEFIVILSRSDLKTAQQVSKNFIEKHSETIKNIVPGSNLGVSIGIAELEPQERGDQWLARADRALYKAKRSGRGYIHSDDLNELEVID